MEGLSSAGNIQGSPEDALVAIFKSKSIDHLLKWVDDFVFFCIPNNFSAMTHMDSPFQYSYGLVAILAITELLGVPWNPVDVKGQDFQSVVPYVGFIWSLDKHTVSLSCKKCLKYATKVAAFLVTINEKATHKECQSLHGMLQHITFIY